MNQKLHRPFATILPTAALTALLPAQDYTLYGTGCGTGTGIPLIIAHDSPLIPGMTTRFTLDGALGSPLAIQVMGLTQIAVPVLGCTLLAQPDATHFHLVNALGHAEHVIAVPPVVGLVGLPLYDQWLALDQQMPNGVSFSEGACARITNPQVGVGRFAPTTGSIGTIVTLTLAGIGTNDPDDLCIRVMAPTGGTSLIRALSITPLGGGLSAVTGVLATADRNPVAQGAMGAMRGAGDTVPVPPGVRLSAPAEGWGWQGAGLPEAGGMGGAFQAIPNMGQTPIQFNVVGNSIRATLPAGPYLVNQQITLDVHWDVNCPGQPQVHYDHFLGTMTVLAPMTALQARDEIAQKIAAVFNNLWPGKVNINVPVPGGAEIVVTMIDPTCTIVSGGGSLYVQ
ncbi:MAG: hypothetical protein IPK26_28725 [Planctomycetes bacterium]|nr:hypothetical protein [Planctomycetota bacterium]